MIYLSGIIKYIIKIIPLNQPLYNAYKKGIDGLKATIQNPKILHSKIKLLALLVLVFHLQLTLRQLAL